LNLHLQFEFWTRSVNSNKDRETLQVLYNLGFLYPVPSKFCNQTKILWNCIHESLDANKRGQDGKRRILSIVADQFSYCEIKKNLNVSKIFT
jgi:hypothetical protein